MVTDQARRDLYQALEHSIGQEPAATLMDLLPPVGWADVARRSDLVAVRGEMAELRGEMAELRGEMAELRGEMAELRGELQGEMAGLRIELRGEIADVRNEMAEVRREITELRSHVDAQFLKYVATNVPLMFATAGLVLAAAKLA